LYNKIDIVGLLFLQEEAAEVLHAQYWLETVRLFLYLNKICIPAFYYV